MLAESLVQQVERPSRHDPTPHPLVDINDESTGATTDIVLQLRPGATEGDVRAVLNRIWAFQHSIEVQFPGPVGRVLLAWVDRHRGSDLEARLAMLEAAISAED
jgi:hypothetical protein